MPETAPVDAALMSNAVDDTIAAIVVPAGMFVPFTVMPTRSFAVVMTESDVTWMGEDAVPVAYIVPKCTSDALPVDAPESWPRKTGQGVKWIFCLTAA